MREKGWRHYDIDLICMQFSVCLFHHKLRCCTTSMKIRATQTDLICLCRACALEVWSLLHILDPRLDSTAKDVLAEYTGRTRGQVGHNLCLLLSQMLPVHRGQKPLRFTFIESGPVAWPSLHRSAIDSQHEQIRATLSSLAHAGAHVDDQLACTPQEGHCGTHQSEYECGRRLIEAEEESGIGIGC